MPSRLEIPRAAFPALLPLLGALRPPVRRDVMTEAVELMERVVRRDPKALDLLYERFSGALYAVILGVVKQKEDAEEILCEIFLQVWDKAAGYDRSRGAVYTWLLGMARNRAIDRIRSKGYKNRKLDAGEIEEMDDLASETARSPLDDLLLTERAALVKEALRDLSPEHREVLEIAYFEGFTQSQIAERLALPLGTVKTRTRDGMRSLQAALKGRVEWP